MSRCKRQLSRVARSVQALRAAHIFRRSAFFSVVSVINPCTECVVDLLFNVLADHETSKRQAKLHGNAHAFCRDDLAVYADRLFGDCGAL